jgi:hypothetical protein
MLASNLLRVSVVMILIGLIMGVAMGASEDFRLMPAHAHLNLVGFVAVFLVGLYYAAVPAAAASTTESGCARCLHRSSGSAAALRASACSIVWS